MAVGRWERPSSIPSFSREGRNVTNDQTSGIGGGCRFTNFSKTFSSKFVGHYYVNGMCCHFPIGVGDSGSNLEGFCESPLSASCRHADV